MPKPTYKQVESDVWTSVSIPLLVAKQIDYVVQWNPEFRSRSEFVRAAIRHCMHAFAYLEEAEEAEEKHLEEKGEKEYEKLGI